MAASDLVLALTGASGSPYGIRLLEVLLHSGRTIHLSISPAAVEVIAHELDKQVRLDDFHLADLLGHITTPALQRQVHYHDYRDFQSGNDIITMHAIRLAYLWRTQVSQRL